MGKSKELVVPPVRLRQFDLIQAISREISRQVPNLAVNVRCYNVMIDAVNRIVEAYGKADAVAPEGAGLALWLASDDTGSSSRYMAYVLADGPRTQNSHPVDPSDFGRCYRFMRVCNITDVSPMAEKSRAWSRLVSVWDRLAELWELESPTGECPQLYEAMKELNL